MVARDARGARAGAPALAAAVALALLLALVFADVLLGGRTLSPAAWVPGVLPSGPVAAGPPPPPALRDLEGGAWVDEPAPYVLRRALGAGRLPLWNADVGLGAPLAANPNMAAWSPLQLPANLWPSPWLQDLVWVARVYVLALATCALARALGCGWIAALLAAAALALSGETLDWLVHHPLNTDAFVPGALAAALWVLRGARRARPALALLVAGALLGVKPQSALTAAAFGVALLLAAIADERRRPDGAALARAGALVPALLISGLLAAVALLPFLESHAAASGLVHAGRSTQSEWTLPLATAGGLAGPWALRLTAGPEVAALAGPPRAGLAVLLLALVGVWRARRRAVAWVLAATVLLYLARIFGLVPLSLAGVPVVGAISFVKYCFPLYLALALLAALALDPDARATRSRRAAVVGLAAACVAVAELAWLGTPARPARVDPYAPAPYVTRLQELAAARPGRMTGPVTLAPPLVSSVLGLRDLRAIDVLTPRDGYDFVSQLVAPSEGVVWILADPDPLTAATAPGAAVANLRWILARDPLPAERLPAVVRSALAARRLNRLFATLDRYRIDTALLGGGLTERAGDRRFHWTCRTPCRFVLELQRAPAAIAAGLAAADAVEVTAKLRLRAAGERRAAATLTLAPDAPWQDLWLDGLAVGSKLDGLVSERDAATAATGPATVELEITSAEPATVFVGGLGPSPGRAVERADSVAELAFRAAARARLELRAEVDPALVFESPDALGEAYLATDVAQATDLDQVRRCLVEHPQRAVACVADPASVPPAPPERPPGTARVERSEDAQLAIAVDAARAALLVVSRLDFPGWRATVDGTEAAIVRVHGAMMGIVVPAGRHRVELAYRPRSLLAGALLSLAGVLALVVWTRGFEGHPGRR